MLQIHVEEGEMVCPNCQHVYPISSGIPNMVRDRWLVDNRVGVTTDGFFQLLAEHEIA